MEKEEIYGKEKTGLILIQNLYKEEAGLTLARQIKLLLNSSMPPRGSFYISQKYFYLFDAAFLISILLTAFIINIQMFVSTPKNPDLVCTSQSVVADD